MVDLATHDRRHVLNQRVVQPEPPTQSLSSSRRELPVRRTAVTPLPSLPQPGWNYEIRLKQQQQPQLQKKLGRQYQRVGKTIACKGPPSNPNAARRRQFVRTIITSSLPWRGRRTSLPDVYSASQDRFAIEVPAVSMICGTCVFRMFSHGPCPWRLTIPASHVDLKQLPRNVYFLSNIWQTNPAYPPSIPSAALVDNRLMVDVAQAFPAASLGYALQAESPPVAGRRLTVQRMPTRRRASTDAVWLDEYPALSSVVEAALGGSLWSAVLLEGPADMPACVGEGQGRDFTHSGNIKMARNLDPPHPYPQSTRLGPPLTIARSQNLPLLAPLLINSGP